MLTKLSHMMISYAVCQFSYFHTYTCYFSYKSAFTLSVTTLRITLKKLSVELWTLPALCGRHFGYVAKWVKHWHCDG